LSTDGVKYQGNYPKELKARKIVFFNSVLTAPLFTASVVQYPPAVPNQMFFNNITKFLSCVSFKLKMAP
jgi:hypothetical protein